MSGASPSSAAGAAAASAVVSEPAAGVGGDNKTADDIVLCVNTLEYIEPESPDTLALLAYIREQQATGAGAGARAEQLQGAANEGSSAAAAASAAAVAVPVSSLFAQALGVRELDERRWRGRRADEVDVPDTAFFYSLPADHWRVQMMQPAQGFAVPADPPPSAAVTVTPLHSLLLMRLAQWRDEGLGAAGTDAPQGPDPDAKAAQLQRLLPDLIRRPGGDSNSGAAADVAGRAAWASLRREFSTADSGVSRTAFLPFFSALLDVVRGETESCAEYAQRMQSGGAVHPLLAETPAERAERQKAEAAARVQLAAMREQSGRDYDAAVRDQFRGDEAAFEAAQDAAAAAEAAAEAAACGAPRVLPTRPPPVSLADQADRLFSDPADPERVCAEWAIGVELLLRRRLEALRGATTGGQVQAQGGHLRRAYLAGRLQLVYEMFVRGGWRLENSRGPRDKLAELEDGTHHAPDPMFDNREMQIAIDAMEAHKLQQQ